MGQQSFALPDVGEGLTEAEILQWHVRPGDVVAVNQAIVEIETAKASVELPCPFAGTVTALHVEPGTVVPVGTAIITIETADAAPAAERESVLVGYGVREASTVTRRARRSPAAQAAPRVTEPGASASPAAHTAAPAARPLAKPPVRHLARELGVDLASVRATGEHGEVTRADVLDARGPVVPDSSANGHGARPVTETGPRAGERIPVRGVQRAMADAMVGSAFTAPHVTEWVDVDMTRSLAVIERLRQHPDAQGLRISPMVLVAAGLVRAAVQHPLINSTWSDDADGAHIHVHPEVHLGIAADTPRGLLVPTVKSVSHAGLLELARRIQQAVDTARAGRSTPADLMGGTISLTNIGVFGIDGGTPILPPGQSAILAMGRVLERPWVVDGAVVARPVMQLTLSFDHRVVDGALGSRVLRSVADYLADPAMVTLEERGL